jgi:hypothetical protein
MLGELLLQFIKIIVKVVLLVVFNVILGSSFIPVLSESLTSHIQFDELLKSEVCASHSIIQPRNGKFFDENSDE